MPFSHCCHSMTKDALFYMPSWDCRYSMHCSKFILYAHKPSWYEPVATHLICLHIVDKSISQHEIMPLWHFARPRYNHKINQIYQQKISWLSGMSRAAWYNDILLRPAAWEFTSPHFLQWENKYGCSLAIIWDIYLGEPGIRSPKLCRYELEQLTILWCKWAVQTAVPLTCSFSLAS